MTDTHINAFFGAVDEAKAKVVQAKGELQAAVAALEVKKKEVGYKEPAVVDTPKVEQQTQYTQQSRDPKKK